MTRTDLYFLACIILGLVLGLAYVVIGWGWHEAILYAALVFSCTGLLGGMRR